MPGNLNRQFTKPTKRFANGLMPRGRSHQKEEATTADAYQFTCRARLVSRPLELDLAVILIARLLFAGTPFVHVHEGNDGLVIVLGFLGN